jgi:hypothetical protein
MPISMNETKGNEVSLDQLLNGCAIPVGVSAVKTVDPTNNKSARETNTGAKTLESFHNQNLANIREEQLKLPELRKELQKKRAEFHIFEQSFSAPKNISSSHEIAMLTGRNRL